MKIYVANEKQYTKIVLNFIKACYLGKKSVLKYEIQFTSYTYLLK
jgi:hypothetical protein